MVEITVRILRPLPQVGLWGVISRVPGRLWLWSRDAWREETWSLTCQ